MRSLARGAVERPGPQAFAAAVARLERFRALPDERKIAEGLQWNDSRAALIALGQEAHTMMIAKIEHGASSPTAGLLGRLCSGLEITMSALMAAVESEDAALLTAADQPRWRDRESSLERVAVSPPTSFGAVEVARLSLPADAVIDYPTPPGVAYAQHILGLAGTLRFTLGRRSFEIGPGDCVAGRIDRPTRFEVVGASAADYLVIIERAGA